MYMSNMDNNAKTKIWNPLKSKIKICLLGQIQVALHKIHSEKEFRSSIESALYTNPEWAKQFWHINSK